MGLLIDSSVLIALERSVKNRSGPSNFPPEFEDSSHIAAITVSELFHGVHRANSEQRRARRELFVRHCLDLLPTLPFDRQTAEVHSRIWSDLKKAGRMVGSHDLLIAATAIQHDLAIVTANVRDFERVPGVKVIPWPTA